MADIALDFDWSIEDDGSVSVGLTLEGSDKPLGSLKMDKDLFTDGLEEDTAEFEAGRENDTVFLDWEKLALELRDIADSIDDDIATAKANVEMKRRLVLDRVKEKAA